MPYRSATRRACGKWISDDVDARAASKHKHFHIVEGANRMSMYDVPRYVDEAVATLAAFVKEIR
ncbi:hypothetical protein [Burkholderia sp. PU8-34]